MSEISDQCSLSRIQFSNFCFLYNLGFLSRIFTVHRAAGQGRGYLFNSSLALLPTSQKPRHQSGNNWREFTSAHSLQPVSNREPLVLERKLLTTRLRALCFIIANFFVNAINIYTVQMKIRSFLSFSRQSYMDRYYIKSSS